MKGGGLIPVTKKPKKAKEQISLGFMPNDDTEDWLFVVKNKRPPTRDVIYQHD